MALLGSPVAHAETVQMTHLPTWVQVGPASAVLFSADHGSAHAADAVHRYAFLRVLSAGDARLQVQAYDDNGQPGITAWVDPDDVLPSAPATDWLVSARPTTLFKAADDTAEVARQLEVFTPLQQTDGPVQGRIAVRVYAPDFASVLDQGWVNTADTGPALPPQTRVPG